MPLDYWLEAAGEGRKRKAATIWVARPWRTLQTSLQSVHCFSLCFHIVHILSQVSVYYTVLLLSTGLMRYSTRPVCLPPKAVSEALLVCSACDTAGSGTLQLTGS